MKVVNIKLNKLFLYMAFVIIYILNFDRYINAQTNLSTETDVTNYVNKITDFNSVEGINYSFKRIDITEDNTPFLHDKVKGRKNIWLIEAKNIRLKLKKTSPEFKDRYNRNFKILIDPNNGNLLKIFSKYEGNDPNVGSEPNAVRVEKEFPNEKYLGFPDTPPNISFIGALDIINEFGIGRPYNAKEMDARYVSYSYKGSKPQRVWIINLRGIPEIPYGTPPGGNIANIREVNHIRYIINAESGEILRVGNAPYPEFDTKSD